MIRIALLAILVVALYEAAGQKSSSKSPCIIGCRKECRVHCQEDKPLNDKPVRSCQDAMDKGFAKSGVYKIRPGGTTPGILVKCDFSDPDGAWTILMNREYNHEIGRFNRLWNDYEAGFGNVNGDHWLGLNAMHRITGAGDHEVSIDSCVTIGSISCNQQVFKTFRVGDAGSKYQLTLQDFSAAESTRATPLFSHYTTRFAEYDGKKFSTRDQDNDAHATLHCGELYGAGWWFTTSCLPHLTAVKVVSGPNCDKGYGIFTTNIAHHKIASVEIKVRPRVEPA